jgi:hypothetical protein
MAVSVDGSCADVAWTCFSSEDCSNSTKVCVEGYSTTSILASQDTVHVSVYVDVFQQECAPLEIDGEYSAVVTATMIYDLVPSKKQSRVKATEPQDKIIETSSVFSKGYNTTSRSLYRFCRVY